MNKRESKSVPKRLTVAYLAPDAVVDATATGIWTGVEAGAQKYDLNLIAFPGGNIRFEPDLQGSRGQANIIYEMVTPDAVDGVITWASALRTSAIKSECLTEEQWIAFHDRFRPLPIVTMSEAIPGYPVAIVENWQGMHDLLVHLIEVHGYREIAFIRGPETHPTASARYQAYLDTLAEYKIPIRPELISPPKDWNRALGAQAVALFLDQHKLRPGVDVQALVAASDVFATTAIVELHARGIRVPEDIAVTGFNNSAEARYGTPSITSVVVPFYDQGCEAVRLLHRSLHHEAVPDQSVVPSQPVIHQSCGCVEETVARACICESAVESLSAEGILRDHREEILPEMHMAIQSLEMPDATWAEKTLDALILALEQMQPTAFLAVLREVLSSVTLTPQYAASWQNALSVIQRYMMRSSHSSPALVMLGQARIMLSEAVSRAQALQQLQSEAQARQLQVVSANLLSTFDVMQMVDVLAVTLPTMGIPGCYLALYENPQPYLYPQPAPEWSRLILAYNADGRIPLDADGMRFPTRDLLPPDLLPTHRRYTMMMQSLHFQNSQIGFVLFEVGTRNWPIYDMLRGEISTSLQGALLVRQVKQRLLQLETSAEVARSVSGVLDMDALMHRVVNLVQQRFGLYYVGLFLLEGDRAVLRMGSGAIGRQMATQGFSLPADDSSAVARSLVAGQTQCASDSAALYPLLPQTRTELALPLVTRGKALGALSIHLDQARTFDPAEIAVFEMLAGQLANAVENARAYDAIRDLSERLQAENLRMTAELTVTQRLQQMLLPTESELRQIENLDIAGFMQPAEEIGGDYYDVLRHNGKIKFGIGDVAGHGLESGVIMLMLQTAVRTLLTSDEHDPVRFLNILNRLLHDNLHRMHADRSMTLTLVDYEAQPHPKLRVSGQHEPMLVIRKGGHVEIMDTLNLGFPLGLLDTVEEFVHELTIMLSPGDGLLLYSDGITEAENDDGELYGLSRLCAVASRNWNCSATEIRSRIASDIQHFIGEHTVFDDITFLVIKQQ
ncbi:MAG: SpoIIE family protein phosphatase [Anaerolineae bacterium]|nr:SpoIIE family protein phosphatase [Anaerolineae bacterium]